MAPPGALCDGALLIATLQLLLTAGLAALFTGWAAWLVLAAEAEGDLPRFLADQAAGLPLPRALQVARLALLALAGAATATALGWWEWDTPWALARLGLGVAIGWAAGDLAPRLRAAAAPEAAHAVRRPAVSTLRV
ncbi:MAG: hypothetical protein ACHQXA_09390, partial [Gemmatimonadales bacterium]